MTFKTSTDVAVWDASVFEWSVYHGEMLAGGVYLGADADVARTRAVAACKDFLTFWKDADPDHPIYRQAKAEYAKLQCSPRTARKNGQLPISVTGQVPYQDFTFPIIRLIECDNWETVLQKIVSKHYATIRS